MQKAIEFEIERQIAAHEAGETVNQETRLWDERTTRRALCARKKTRTITVIFPNRICSL
jgi:aspartyl-tRNA(Asn)/glutamyl-tRNA(Gln) amidotransferase subunit B